MLRTKPHHTDIYLDKYQDERCCNTCIENIRFKSQPYWRHLEVSPSNGAQIAVQLSLLHLEVYPSNGAKIAVQLYGLQSIYYGNMGCRVFKQGPMEATLSFAKRGPGANFRSLPKPQDASNLNGRQFAYDSTLPIHRPFRNR